MREIVDITKALADETRLRIMAMLLHGELCVCQILELFELAPSTVSKHLYILKSARLVETRKEGKWMYYRLPTDKEAAEHVRDTVKWLKGTLKSVPEVREDYRKLKGIVQIDPQELCDRRKEAI